MLTEILTKPSQDSPKSKRESRRTERLRNDLPRGITIGLFKDGRPKPFWVRYGSPKRLESFANEDDRNDRAQALYVARVEQGEQVMRFDPKEWEEFQAWKASRVRVSSSMSIADAVAEYLRVRSGDGLAEDTLRHLKINLRRFSEFFEGSQLAQLDTERVEKWLAHLRKERGFGPVTVKHNLKQVKSFLNYAKRAKWIAENPCVEVPIPKVLLNEDVCVLSLREAFEFFKANRNTRAIGRLAAEAFGGLRNSSAERLGLEDLDFENRAIVMPGAKHKTGRRYYVDGWPRNLWRWLAHAPQECWQIKPRAYAHEKTLGFARARVENPGNVFRHTFATMHLAAFKDAPALAVLLTHRDISMLLTHYRGRGVSQAVARAYFCITPKTIELSWERFCEKMGVKAVA